MVINFVVTSDNIHLGHRRQMILDPKGTFHSQIFHLCVDSRWCHLLQSADPTVLFAFSLAFRFSYSALEDENFFDGMKLSTLKLYRMFVLWLQVFNDPYFRTSTLFLVSFSGYFLPCMCLQTNLLPKVGSIWFLTQMNLFKKCNSQIWHILSNFAVFSDF